MILMVIYMVVEFVSSKIKSLRASQSESWRGETHQGNPEVLDIGNWPQTQQLD